MPAPTLFIVEDDLQVTNLIKVFLTRTGYSIAGSSTRGDDAILQVERLRPDLVLMDIHLDGDVDGIQAAKVIASRLETPVVFLTGMADEETIRRSQEASAFGYVLKPFEQEDLKAAVDLALSKHKIENRLRQNDRALGAAICSISEAVITTDPSGRVTFLNPAAENLLGMNAAAAVGKPLNRVFPIREEPTAITAKPPTPAPENSSDLRFDALLSDRHGEEIPIECSAAPIRAEDGRTLGRVIVFRDISERRRAEFELHESHEQLRALTGHLQAARETERLHIAREIHDEFGQSLTGLRMDLVWMDRRLSTREPSADPAELRKRLAGTLALVDNMVQQVRRIASDLRPGILDDLGLVAALDWQAREWQLRTGITCDFRSGAEQVEASPDESVALFRIFQEALTNVARHASARQVKASLTTDDGQLMLRIEDNGRGFDTAGAPRTGSNGPESALKAPANADSPSAHSEASNSTSPAEPRPSRSFGLLGMKERAAAVGGTLSIDSRPGAGTTVVATLPNPRQKAA